MVKLSRVFLVAFVAVVTAVITAVIAFDTIVTISIISEMGMGARYERADLVVGGKRLEGVLSLMWEQGRGPSEFLSELKDAHFDVNELAGDNVFSLVRGARDGRGEWTLCLREDSQGKVVDYSIFAVSQKNKAIYVFGRNDRDIVGGYYYLSSTMQKSRLEEANTGNGISLLKNKAWKRCDRRGIQD